MTRFRENLIDRMCHIYGLENPIVIHFAGMCEELDNNDWNNKYLMLFVEGMEAHGYFCEEE